MKKKILMSFIRSRIQNKIGNIVGAHKMKATQSGKSFPQLGRFGTVSGFRKPKINRLAIA
jgi:hypothetical protein